MKDRAVGMACVLWWLASACSAAQFPERKVMEGEGYHIEYSAGDEAYAKALVQRLPLEMPGTVPTASLPLTVVDLRAKRETVLKLLAEQLALAAPTPKMAQTFDAFSAGYIALQSLSTPRPTRFALWRKPELAARLASGQHIEGFTRNADGEIGFSLGVSFQFGEGQQPQDSIARVREDMAHLTWPVKIGEKSPAAPDTEIDERLGELRENANQLGAFQSTELQRLGVVTVLHETIESTLVDAYVRSSDRRWFCEGVANYLAYRVLESLAGVQAARSYYDVDAEVAKFAARRQDVDLEHWRVAEDPRSSELSADTNTASYAFATQAVFEAFAQEPPGTLARVLAEVRKTPIEKSDMHVVQAAYRRVTGRDLRAGPTH